MDHELRIKNILFFIFLFTIFYLLFSIPAHAQSMRSITIIPAAWEHTLSPGENAEGTLTVINNGAEPITFHATVRDYVVSDNQGTPQILPPNTLSNKYSGASWIGVEPETFRIDPRQQEELDYFIQVPQDAKPGGHYAAVMYEPVEFLNTQGSGANVSTQIGTLFYIHVKGDIREDARVLRFETKRFGEHGPVAINTEILNNGDLHVRPKGLLTVKNMLGQTVETKALSEHNIFPEKSFLYKNELGSRWMIGRYTAQLSATYGLANNLPLVATASFIIFPWKAASIVVLLVVIIVLAILAVKRKKHSHESGEQSSPTDHPAL